MPSKVCHNHPQICHNLCFFVCFHQTGFLGLCGAKVDAIDHHNTEIDKLSKEVSTSINFFFLGIIYIYFLHENNMLKERKIDA